MSTLKSLICSLIGHHYDRSSRDLVAKCTRCGHWGLRYGTVEDN